MSRSSRQPSHCMALVSMVVFCGWSSFATGFDTGHHHDLTASAMRSLGFQEHAIKVAQLENWLVDYYSNQPAVGLHHDLEKLHFDNLLTKDRIAAYWAHLRVNARQAFQDATTQGDSMKVVALLGMSLHAVQDFYTHSNWVEEHLLPSNEFLTDSYFDNPAVASHATLRTGQYPNQNPPSPTDHGDGTPSSPGMNHDSYARARWEQSHVFAFCASRQWIQAASEWVKGVSGGDTVWQNALTLSFSSSQLSQLNTDLHAAYRISEWAPGGHWKGPGSAHLAEFGPFLASWQASHDSVFVDHFKVNKWHKLLTDRLEENGPPTGSLPVMPTLSHPFFSVSVRTLLVEELPVGTFESRIDTGANADFYAKVRINGQWFTESMQLDKKSVQPHWSSMAFVPTSLADVSIRYELWDEDGGIAGDDDRCDIYHKPGERSLELTMNLASETLSGDLSGVHSSVGTAIETAGATPDKDRAKVQLVFSKRNLSP